LGRSDLTEEPDLVNVKGPHGESAQKRSANKKLKKSLSKLNSPNVRSMERLPKIGQPLHSEARNSFVHSDVNQEYGLNLNGRNE